MSAPRLALAPALAVAAVVLTAVALTGAAAPNVPYWSQEPTRAEREAAFTAAGVKATDIGRGVVSCKVKADGGLEACRLMVDSSSGGGFGRALMAMAPLYRVNMSAPKAPAPGEDAWFSHSAYPVDTPPDWLKKPNARDLMAVWPTEAYRQAKGGAATINCLISVQGALYDCVPVSETPAGQHFGAAAVALAPQFLMKPATLKGQPVVSAVSIPIVFAMERGARPEPPPRRPDLNPDKGMISAALAWVQAPSYADVVAAYPPKAMETHLAGRATLDCRFDRLGRLKNCITITEEPKQRGFAKAALDMSNRFRAAPTLADGRSIEGVSVQLPFVFDPVMMAASPPIVGKAQWVGLPTAEETSAAFGALKVEGTARAKLSCTVVQGGAVTDCKVVDETPAGAGFGAAALSLTPHFRLTTWTVEGLPTVGGLVTIPLRYDVKEPPAAK